MPHTVSTRPKIQHISNFNIDKSKKAFVSLREFTPVEYLNWDYGWIVNVSSERHVRLFANHCKVELTYMSNASFQYGSRVLALTAVEYVCSPSEVTIANGSGNRYTSRWHRPSAATTMIKGNIQWVILLLFNFWTLTDQSYPRTVERMLSEIGLV